jgi:guanylate kinase
MTSESCRTKMSKTNTVKPLLVVLSGPSGTGKSSIVAGLLKERRNFRMSVSATTRKKRLGERDGRDYFFLTANEFRNKMKRTEFIETARVFNEWYGTPKKPVLEALNKNRTVLFDIDIQGGMAIKKWRQDTVLIFVLPPSLAVLKQRLVKRQSESAASMKLRLAHALKEIEFWSKYDYVVCNKDLNETVELVAKIIRAESQRVSRCGNLSLQ